MRRSCVNTGNNILFVNQLSGFAGGVERYIFRAANLLTEAGFAVDGLFAEETRGSEQFKTAFRCVLTENDLEKPDFPAYALIVVHKTASPELLRNLRAKGKVAVFVHDHEYYCPRRSYYYPFTRKNCARAYHKMFCGICGALRGGGDRMRNFTRFPELWAEVKKSDRLLVLSEFMREMLLRQGVPAEKITLIPPAVEPVETPEKNAVSGPKRLLTPGQLIRGKGVDLLLRALPLVRGEFVAEILGAGKDRAMLEKLASPLGDQVVFQDWTDEPEKFYRQAYAVVLPWRWQEPFGLVGPEAMAHGLPLAAFDTGAVKEYLRDGETGFLAPEGNIEKLADAISRLLADPEQAGRMGSAGRAFVAEHYTRENFLAAWRETIRKTAESKRGLRLFVCCVPYDNGKSGISVYIRNVVRELLAAGHELTLAVESGAAAFFQQFNCRMIVLPKWCSHSVASMLYCLFLLPFQIDPEKYDRLIVTAANRRMLAFTRGLPVTAVVHDLSQFHVAVKYDFLRMFYVKYILAYYLKRRATDVAVISRSTYAAVTRYWKVPKEKLFINYNGVDRTRLPAGENDARDKIVLYVSRIEAPGKNHANLIRAWELLPEELAGQYKLVLAGQDWSGAEEVHELARRSPYARQIEFTGFIEHERLMDLYRHAALCVFPSLYEGFGLPLIEAMVCGLVCACSKNSALGEIGGNAALKFNPRKPKEIADAIREGLTNEPLRAELRAKGLVWQTRFDWAKHAEMLTEEHSFRATVFGIHFSTRTMAGALEDIRAMIADGKKHTGAFINADALNQAFQNRRYANLLNEFDAVWPDGVGVAIAARHLLTPVRENVNGTDMLPHLCRAGYRLYLLGAAPGVAERAAQCLTREYPGTRIAGWHDGFFPAEKTAEIVAAINAAKPDILLVAMGVPKQEFWIAEHRNELDCPLAMGVGGLFDFASHRIPRAPGWMRAWRLEWVYRLRQEPRRLFKRYVIGNPLFLYRVIRFGRRHPDPAHREKNP